MPKHILVGDTLKVTWVNSGSTASEATAVIFNGDEVAVNSVTMISSGNGHYYANYTVPTSAQWMVAETCVWVNSLSYRRRTKFRVVTQEVD